MIRFEPKTKLSEKKEENRFKQVKDAAIAKRKKSEIAPDAKPKKA